MIFIIITAAFWIELPSISEFRKMAIARPIYCATIVDRNKEKIDALYNLPNQSEFIPLDSVPQYFIKDLIFFEDRFFYSNPGIWPPSIIKVLLSLREGGASTLTQQLYRIVTGHKEKSIFRKYSELVGAIKIWFGLTKEEVLQLYINNCYFGAGSKLGLSAAAEHFFSKQPSQLTRAESIMLISFLNFPPSNLSRSLDRIYERYKKRVERLKERGLIDPGEKNYREILTGPSFNPSRKTSTSYGVFLDRVIEEANNILMGSKYSLEFSGLVIHTSLDKKGNDLACNIIEEFKKNYTKSYASFILFNQENEVIIYIGGGKTLRGEFDHLRDLSMPASRLKILAYALVVDDLLSKGYTPEEILNYELPTIYTLSDGKVIKDNIQGPISLRQAIAKSENAPAYYVSNELVSPVEISHLAEKFKVTLFPYPSISMGTQPFPEFNLAWVYSTLLVRNGFLKYPSYIKAICTADGDTIYDSKQMRLRKEPQIISSKTGKILKQALRESVEYGTSKNIKEFISLKSRDVCAKTGTSEQYYNIGTTGVIDNYTFSLLLQSRYLKKDAGIVAVPLAGKILNSLVHNGYEKVVTNIFY